MAKKEKLNRYIEKYLHPTKIIEAAKSTYYIINGREIRVSDHVGLTSDGNLHIIFDSADNGNYILFCKSTGEISVVSYKDVKIVLKSILLLPGITTLISESCDPIDDISSSKQFILGVPASKFTKGQLKVIKQTAKKAATKQQL